MTPKFRSARIFAQRDRASLVLDYYRKKMNDDSIYIKPCLVEMLEVSL